MAPVSVCHHVSTIGSRCHRCASRYHIHSLGVDGFADRTEQSQGRHVEAGWDVVAPLHEGTNRRRRGVEERDAVLLDQLPPATLVWGVRRPLVHHLCGAVGHRSIHDVGVTGYPADVGGAPVDVRRRT